MNAAVRQHLMPDGLPMRRNKIDLAWGKSRRFDDAQRGLGEDLANLHIQATELVGAAAVRFVAGQDARAQLGGIGEGLAPHNPCAQAGWSAFDFAQGGIDAVCRGARNETDDTHPRPPDCSGRYCISGRSQRDLWPAMTDAVLGRGGPGRDQSAQHDSSEVHVSGSRTPVTTCRIASITSSGWSWCT